MFSPPGSDNEESRIKQRLVGALVLIALAVIIVPLFLDFRKDYDHVIKGTNIPPKPDDFHVEVVPLVPPGDFKAPPGDIKAPPEENKLPPGDINPPPDSTDQDESESAPPPPASPAPANVKKPPAAKPVVPAPKAEAAKPPDKAPVAAVQNKESPAATEGDAWIVQLGSFSNIQNAEDLREQLQKKGYKAFVDDVRVNDRTIHRVRIGPIDKKAEAEAVRDKLAPEMKLDASVFSYP